MLKNQEHAVAIPASGEVKRKVLPFKLKGKASDAPLPGLWKTEHQIVAPDPSDNPSDLKELSIINFTPSSTSAAASIAWEEEIEAVKELLLKARRQAILSRSQTLNLTQRRWLCREAMSLFEKAQNNFGNLKGRALRAGLTERRRIRSIEGATEWRSIRHAIKRSAELNQMSTTEAA